MEILQVAQYAIGIELMVEVFAIVEIGQQVLKGQHIHRLPRQP